MKRALVLLFLLGCKGDAAADTDTDTDTDASDEFGSFDSNDEFTSIDDNDVFGGSTTTGGDPNSTSSTTQEPETATDTDGSTTMMMMATSSSSGTDTDPTNGDPGNCCEAHPEKTGCENPAVEDCVCEMDAQCCDLTWDDACVVGVVIYGCGLCEGIGGDGDCCMAHDNPGCDDDEIEACVCAMDIACCNDVWDQICVDEIADFRCAPACP